MERELGVVVHTFNSSTNENNRNTTDIKSFELSSALYH